MNAYPAPAKLNLFLHITGRRADGYHLLQTLFQLIDLCDRMRIEPLGTAALELECDRPDAARRTSRSRMSSSVTRLTVQPIRVA